MTNIVVLIKQVPDTWSERKLSEDDWTLDREAADAVLDEINERAVEEALLIKEKEGGDSTVTVLTAGPERSGEPEPLRLPCEWPQGPASFAKVPLRSMEPHSPFERSSPLVIEARE